MSGLHGKDRHRYARRHLDVRTPLRRAAARSLLAAGVVGLVLAGTVALWAHYGTAMFFETIRAGFVACFG